MIRGNKYKKIFQALNFFAIAEDGEINKMKALKLIWLADRLHLRKYGRTITGDTYYALKNGSVPSSAKKFAEANDYIKLTEKQYGDRFIQKVDVHHYKSVNAVDIMVFSKTDIDIMNIIYKTFSGKDQYELGKLSHKFPEWKRFEDNLKKKPHSNYLMEMEDFFEEGSVKLDIFNQSAELLEVSREDFLGVYV